MIVWATTRMDFMTAEYLIVLYMDFHHIKRKATFHNKKVPNLGGHNMFMCKECKRPLRAKLTTTHTFKVSMVHGSISPSSHETKSGPMTIVCSADESHICGYYYSEQGEIKEWTTEDILRDIAVR